VGCELSAPSFPPEKLKGDFCIKITLTKRIERLHALCGNFVNLKRFPNATGL